MSFTTRPEIRGTFGVVTSTHWLASSVGMRMLERGGNAFDAAAATAFALHVVEPHLNGPLGEVPIIFCKAGSDRPQVLCGQGVAPAKATIGHFRSVGLTRVPGSGLLATVVPGAFDAWMQLLRDHGSLPLRAILEPAIHYARHGHPMLARVATTIADMKEFFETEWPTSAATWCPGGRAPQADELFVNPELASTWERLLAEAEVHVGHEAQYEAARKSFYRGFVAEAIDAWMRDAEVMDAEGGRRKGVLTGDDMARWEAAYEEPLSTDYHGWTVYKTGPWGQGPALLQALNILDGTDIGEIDLLGPEFVHRVVETIKLAMADREAYYGDPLHSDIPVERLLSREHAAGRRALLGERASLEQRPGHIPGLEAWAQAAVRRASAAVEGGVGAGAGEPTMAHLSERRGDTVHIDVIDRHGNMISATPSGGWLQSSPVVPGLGMPLNTRGQMFWMEEGLPTSLAPGRRPRTTLTPSLAAFEGRPCLCFGTPGGDQQDQWQLILFLRLVHSRMNLQEAIDTPLFHTAHFQSSFYPRAARPGHLMIEPSAGDEVIGELRRRGHDIEVSDAWAVGRLTAALRETNGLLRAAATPRLMQAYAVGR
ncbi:MAG: gamma-glutamyltransferase family protein [Geminicoccaceae bacterium]